MEIRKAEERDIPPIIELLRKSLGESLMPKSEEFWRWKHVENPFGASPVLLAIDGKSVIGVRAFMRWAWRFGDHDVEAVRAVDTATHPDFQGRGIFSTLTKQLLRECQEKGIDLVFNTPNRSSLPGYVKMGWQRAGTLPVNFRLINPVRMGLRLVSQPFSFKDDASDNSLTKYLDHPGLSDLMSARYRVQGTGYTTPYTVEGLRWRYQRVPVAKYYAGAAGDEKKLDGLFIYRMKPSRAGLEFRITEVFVDPASRTEVLKKSLNEHIRKQNPDFITMGSFANGDLIDGGLSFFNRKLGPVVTVRGLNIENIGNFVSFSRWAPSLGDLELF